MRLCRAPGNELQHENFSTNILPFRPSGCTDVMHARCKNATSQAVQLVVHSRVAKQYAMDRDRICGQADPWT